LNGEAAIATIIATSKNVQLTGNPKLYQRNSPREQSMASKVFGVIFFIFMVFMFIKHPRLMILMLLMSSGGRGGRSGGSGGFGGGFGGGGFGGGGGVRLRCVDEGGSFVGTKGGLTEVVRGGE
jgi:hypothetical protein